MEEFSRKLQGDAEKLAVYERRSLGGVNGSSVASHHVGASGGSREEQLEAEVAELRYVCGSFVLHAPSLTWVPTSAELKVAEVDLQSAHKHIQQFKEISQANEEALASLNTTHDEYKSTTESQLATSWVCAVPVRAHLSSCANSRASTFRLNKKHFRAVSQMSSKSSSKPKRPWPSRNVRWRVHVRSGSRTRRCWKTLSWT